VVKNQCLRFENELGLNFTAACEDFQKLVYASVFAFAKGCKEVSFKNTNKI